MRLNICDKKYKLIFIISTFIIYTLVFSKYTFASSITNKWISNEVYNSYYYNQLDEDSGSRLIYNVILQNIEKTMYGTSKDDIKCDLSKYNIVVNEDTWKIFQAAIDAFDRDHPEVFWLDINKMMFSYTSFEKNNVMYVKNAYIQYNLSYSSYLIDEYDGYDDVYSDYEKVQAIVSRQLPYINAFGNNTYEKVKYIHDYLVANNEYNSDLLSASRKSLKCVSALLGNTKGIDAPICEGYARAFKVFCDKAAIPCVIVSGNANVDGDNVSHMWNSVLIDDYWYTVDVTWDDPVITSGSYDELSYERKYAYFLKGDILTKTDHISNGMFTKKDGYDMVFEYPELATEDYDIKVETYSISTKNTDGGKIEYNIKDTKNIAPGTTIIITIKPDKGMEYVEGSLKLNDRKFNSKTFTMPSKNVEIYCKFRKIQKSDKKNDSLGHDSLSNEDISASASPENKEKDKATINSGQTNYNSKVENSVNHIDSSISKDSSNSILQSDNDNKQNKIIYTVKDKKQLDDLFENLTSNNYAISINNNSSLSIGNASIMAGEGKDALLYDIILSICDTIYTNEDIYSLIQYSGFSLSESKYITAFSMQVLNANDGSPGIINERSDGIGVLLPLNPKYFDKKECIDLYYINDYTAYQYDYQIVSFANNYYIYFTLYNSNDMFAISYNGNDDDVKADDNSTVNTNSFITGSSYKANKINENTSDKTQKNTALSSINILVFGVIILLAIIISLNVYFLVHIKMMNKKMNNQI